MNLKQLLSEVHTSGTPDLHLHVGKHPIIRLQNGDVASVEAFPILTKEYINDIIDAITSDDQKKRFKEEREIDFSFTYEDLGRFRVNIFQENEGPALALRVISEYIPKLDELGIDDSIKDLLMLNNGLILVTGPTGSGKSTTLASMIDFININKKVHILTIEDPIEFIYTDSQSLVTQREVNIHTYSFSKAIRSALRQDPDVVMIGEMRDLETISAAMTLAETGHLVLSTLHTTDSVQTIDRIIDAFPANQQDQIRHQISTMLKGVISQVLIPRLNNEGRVAAREVMMVNDGIKNCISKGDTHQIYSLMQVGLSEGMISLNESLEQLVRAGDISKESALVKSIDFDDLSTRLKDIK